MCDHSETISDLPNLSEHPTRLLQQEGLVVSLRDASNEDSSCRGKARFSLCLGMQDHALAVAVKQHTSKISGDSLLHNRIL